MAAIAFVTAEVDASVEREASEVLADIGLTTSDVLRMTLQKVARDKVLPAAIRKPNSATIEALREADAGGGSRFATVDDLFADLGI